ncbi:hypothetical protein DBR06_SOUSAS110449 [Sousa chinensis]|uniref:Uncharacterized protein n=1 Tax=Sousa chinensis TaxID=103600 RepID=A0A484GRK5_SOUCH|nr:hypothetical protein DBR06_SOUSAS110449 [Sousa chinensis]
MQRPTPAPVSASRHSGNGGSGRAFPASSQEPLSCAQMPSAAVVTVPGEDGAQSPEGLENGNDSPLSPAGFKYQAEWKGLLLEFGKHRGGAPHRNSACSDLSSQVILKVAWNKRSVGSGGGGRERVDSGKADLATHFPSVCENVKPKMHSIGKNGNNRGAKQARLPAFPHTYPTAKTHLPLGKVERWNQVRKDTELGQNDFRRGSEWPRFQQTTGLGHGEPLKDTLITFQALSSPYNGIAIYTKL